jgi:hypothetical protein
MNATKEDISVHILEGGLCATIHLPAGLDCTLLTGDLLRMIAVEAKVEATTEVERRLASIVEDYKANPRDLVVEIAHSVEPTNGSEGGWTWEPQFDPATRHVTAAADGESVDYHATHIVSVANGTPVARLITPNGGTDGRSVTGEVLPAKPGRAAAMRIGKGLQARPDGVVVATYDGVLSIHKGEASVSPVLEVKGCVDFSTGNIDFKGDVVVTDTVHDEFQVRAQGNITVGGQIEGAVIVCGGGLTCPHGVASAHRAKLLVDGDSSIGYIRNASAVFRKNLMCRSEIQHSDIVVGGDLRCDSGRIIGGRVSLTGTAHIGTLGSPEWTPTVLNVGTLPIVAIELRRLAAEAARIEKIIAAKNERHHHLQCGAAGNSASAREELTELQYEVSELRREALGFETKIAELQQTARAARKVELHILRIVYPRVRLQHGASGYEFEREIKGPLQFLIDAQGAIMVRVSSLDPRPISDFTHLVLSNPAPGAAVKHAA